MTESSITVPVGDEGGVDECKSSDMQVRALFGHRKNNDKRMMQLSQLPRVVVVRLNPKFCRC